jgi:Fic family protein
MSSETESKPGPKPRITLERIIEVFDGRTDRAEPLSSTEVAAALNCSRRTAGRKLDALVETGTLASKKPGGRSRVYWVPLPERGKQTEVHE